MSVNPFWAAFSLTVVSEMACLARNSAVIAKFGSPASVITGTILGNVVILVASYFLGTLLQSHTSENSINFIIGAIFVVLGILSIIGKGH